MNDVLVFGIITKEKQQTLDTRLTPEKLEKGFKG